MFASATLLVAASIAFVSASPHAKRQCQPSLGNKDVKIPVTHGDVEWSYTSQDINVELGTANAGTDNSEFRFSTNTQGKYWITASGEKNDYLAVHVNNASHLAFEFWSQADEFTSMTFDVQCSDCTAVNSTLATGCSILTYDNKCIQIETTAERAFLGPASECTGMANQLFNIIQ